MGFIRKALIIGTGGLAPVKSNSAKERTAKATERLARGSGGSSVTVSLGELIAAKPRSVQCPACEKDFVSPLSPNIGCPHCRARVSVARSGGRWRAELHAAP